MAKPAPFETGKRESSAPATPGEAAWPASFPRERLSALIATLARQAAQDLFAAGVSNTNPDDKRPARLN